MAKKNRRSVPATVADVERYPATGADVERYMNEFINTACDMVDIDGLSPDVPKGFIIRSLIRDGRVAYLDRNDPSAGWYNAQKSGEPNRYGYYDTLYLTEASGINGFYATVRDGVREIRANATAYPPFLLYEKYTKQLSLCDRAITANIRASILSRILPVDDASKRTSVEIALQDVEEGLPIVVDGMDVMEAFMKSSDISTTFIADRLIGVRSAIWSDAAVRLGTISGNQYKKERVQSAEVDASVAETIDAVYVMINTFNEDCQRHGLPFRMHYTGYAARYDEDALNTTEEGETTNE